MKIGSLWAEKVIIMLEIEARPCYGENFCIDHGDTLLYNCLTCSNVYSDHSPDFGRDM